MLPVTILTGFLGGGKTTLVRRLLGSPWGRRIGILMNERGLAGIDDVGGAGSDAGFVELAEGCVCCVDQPDLILALEQLAKRGDLDRILLETTGLADPLPISWTVARPDLAELVSLEAVVTVVDAANHEATRVEEWEAQVRAADVVVLSKLDLVDAAAAEKARSAVREINPSARLLSGDEALLALVGDEAIFGPGWGGRGSAPSSGERPLARHGSFGVISIRGSGEYDADKLEDLVEELPAEVFRAKGVARIGEERWLKFHSVAGRAQIDLDAPAPAHGESRLLFFGRGLDRAVIEARLEACRPGA